MSAKTIAPRFGGGDQVPRGKAGDKVQITWTDNKGDKRTDEIVVA